MRAANPRKAMKCGIYHTRVLVAVYSLFIMKRKLFKLAKQNGCKIVEFNHYHTGAEPDFHTYELQVILKNGEQKRFFDLYDIWHTAPSDPKSKDNFIQSFVSFLNGY